MKVCTQHEEGAQRGVYQMRQQTRRKAGGEYKKQKRDRGRRTCKGDESEKQKLVADDSWSLVRVSAVLCGAAHRRSL